MAEQEISEQDQSKSAEQPGTSPAPAAPPVAPETPEAPAAPPVAPGAGVQDNDSADEVDEDRTAGGDRTFIARASAFVNLDGAPVRIKKGITRVREGHPLLDEHGGLFELAGASVHFDTVETTRETPAAPPAAAKRAAARKSPGRRRGKS